MRLFSIICNNSSIKHNNQLYKLQKIPLGIYFDNVSKKLQEQDWWYKDIKRR